MAKQTKKQVGAWLQRSGVLFRVWAPFANHVAVTGSFNDWGVTDLASEGDGYWSAEVEQAEAGQEYKYVITNGDKTLTKNDPRAMQVTTTAGNSVIVDTEFDWEDVNPPNIPFNQQVIYEMHVGTFNRPDPATPGTFASAQEKLDYLKDLGVTTIEIMPIGSMSMTREWWGYTPDYIYAVETLYGGRHQFLKFIKAAHQRGLAVVLDVVYNHLGPDNSLDLWQFDGWSENDKGGIYFYNDWRSKTPWADTRPDYGRPEVRQYILDNVRMWMNDFRLDGLRVDSTIFIRNAKGNNDDPDNDLADGWHLLQRITDLSRKINANALVVAEDVGANDYLTKPVNEGGAGFSSQWATNFPHALRVVLNATNDADRNLSALCDELKQVHNGDVFKRVIYGDSHDSAANGGARLSEEIAPGNASSLYARKRSLLAAAITLTTPGIPMLLQGQEFMQGGSFTDWQALEWDKAEQFAGIVEANAHLLALRTNRHGTTVGLTSQSFNILHVDEDNKVMAYHRWQDGGPGDDVIVVINFANKLLTDYKLPMPRAGRWQLRFNSAWNGYSPDFKDIKLDDINVEDGQGTFVLPPYAALILSQDAA
jgi:1,4-alpha-glucan branching enzyme